VFGGGRGEEVLELKVLVEAVIEPKHRAGC
jgi:hypothetical protein